MSDPLMSWREVAEHMGISEREARAIGKCAAKKLRAAFFEDGIVELLIFRAMLRNAASQCSHDNLEVLLPESHRTIDESDPTRHDSLWKAK